VDGTMLPHAAIHQGGWHHAATIAAMLTDSAHRVWQGPAAELAGNGCDDATDSCMSG
jgi:epoxyqueuosine reductase QueG